MDSTSLATPLQPGLGGRESAGDKRGRLKCAGVVTLLSRFLNLTREVVARYLSCDCGMRAASLAYFGLAGLFPCMLLMLTVVGHFVSSDVAQQRLVEILAWYVPVPALRPFALDNLHALVEWRGVMGVTSLLLLLWSSKGTFLAVQRGLSVVWGLERNHHQVVAYGLSIFYTVLVGLLLVLQFSLIATMRAAVTWQVPLVGLSPTFVSTVWTTTAFLISPAVLFTIFFLLFRFSTPERPPVGATCAGAFFSALCYRVTESGFIAYLASFSRATVLYGAASGLVVLMLWMYLTANIFFIGGALIHVLTSASKSRGGVCDIACEETPP